MRLRESKGSLLFDVSNHTILFLVLVATLYPFLYVASVSISDPQAVLQNRISFYPIGLNFNAYLAVFDNPSIWTSYKNTIVYTTVGTFINLLLTTLMAYALSKRSLYARKFFTVMTIFTMFFQGGLIPTYIVVNHLGLINSMWSVILPIAVSTWNLILMRTFFQEFPAELEEAATIDGCNPLQVLLRIVLPLSKPIIATISLFYAVWHWNAYLAPLIYLHDKVKFPLQILLQQILISGETSFADAVSSIDSSALIIGDSVKYATIIVAIFPILMVYPFIQKYFVKGMLIGSVKG